MAVPHLVKMAEMPPAHPDWLTPDHSHWSKRTTKEDLPKVPSHKVCDYFYDERKTSGFFSNILLILLYSGQFKRNILKDKVSAISDFFLLAEVFSKVLKCVTDD